MTIIRNFIRYFIQLYLNGIIFILFILGYCFLNLLRIFRIMKKSLFFILPVVILALLLTPVYLLFNYFMAPFGNERQQIVEYVIIPKTSLQDAAQFLEKERVIRSAKALRIWMRFNKTERKMRAGLAIFNRGDGIKTAATRLLFAKPIEISVMVPEGLTIDQTAQHIARSYPVDTAKFVALCHDSAFIASCGIQAPSLEGYLFPSTYRLPEKASAEEIIKRMTAQHSAVWSQITVQPELAAKLSHHQIVTMASIVEREATLNSEQPRISGVFHNRLRLGYPLGADPTVRYALKKFSGALRVSELNSNSPYNTRKFPGLPPGPICSPGKGALEAAANPLATKDMYFVAKWDGSGEHDFSVTNAEHDRKKIAIRNYNEMRKRKASREK